MLFLCLVGSDFIAISQLVNFLPGATPTVNGQVCFPFAPIDDTIVEFKQDILLMVSSANPDIVFNGPGGDMASIQICDNDSKFDTCLLLMWHQTPSPGNQGFDIFVSKSKSQNNGADLPLLMTAVAGSQGCS